MKNKTIILFSIFALFLSTGCMPKFETEGARYLSVEETFKPYVNRFFEYSADFGGAAGTDNLVVVMDNSMAGPQPGQSWVLAVCQRGGGNPPTIKVNPHFWNNSFYGHSDREELIFHELGHCVLNRGHDSTITTTVDFGDRIPVSIMYPYHLGTYRYGTNYEHYIKELFYQPQEIAMRSIGPNLFNAAYYGQDPTNPVAVVEPPPPVTGPIKPPVISSAVAMGKLNADGNFEIEYIHCGDE